MSSPKLYMITFGSEGKPHDDGFPLKQYVDIMREKFEPHVDYFEWFTPRTMKEKGFYYYVCDYGEKHKDMFHNINYQKVGLGRWRPSIILQTLEKMNYGDFLFQQDCNMGKYKFITDCAEYIRKIFDYSLHDRDIFLTNEFDGSMIRTHVKAEIIDYFAENNPYYYLDLKLFVTPHFLCRKTDKVISIVKEWYDNCHVELLSGITDVKYYGFDHNTFEQGIINMILRREMKNGKIPGPRREYYSDKNLMNIYDEIKKDYESNKKDKN